VYERTRYRESGKHVVRLYANTLFVWCFAHPLMCVHPIPIYYFLFIPILHSLILFSPHPPTLSLTHIHTHPPTSPLIRSLDNTLTCLVPRRALVLIVVGAIVIVIIIIGISTSQGY
jgi:hypothetical protein